MKRININKTAIPVMAKYVKKRFNTFNEKVVLLDEIDTDLHLEKVLDNNKLSNYYPQKLSLISCDSSTKLFIDELNKVVPEINANNLGKYRNHTLFLMHRKVDYLLRSETYYYQKQNLWYGLIPIYPAIGKSECNKYEDSIKKFFPDIPFINIF